MGFEMRNSILFQIFYCLTIQHYLSKMHKKAFRCEEECLFQDMK